MLAIFCKIYCPFMMGIIVDEIEHFIQMIPGDECGHDTTRWDLQSCCAFSIITIDDEKGVNIVSSHCTARHLWHRSVKLGFNPFHVDCLSSRQCSSAAAPCFPFQPNIFASCWNNLLTFNYELGGRVGGNELTVCSEENILLGPGSSLGCIVVITERINHRCTPHYALLELTEWPQAGLQLLHIKIYFII